MHWTPQANIPSVCYVCGSYTIYLVNMDNLELTRTILIECATYVIIAYNLAA